MLSSDDMSRPRRKNRFEPSWNSQLRIRRPRRSRTDRNDRKLSDRVGGGGAFSRSANAGAPSVFETCRPLDGEPGIGAVLGYAMSGSRLRLASTKCEAVEATEGERSCSVLLMSCRRTCTSGMSISSCAATSARVDGAVDGAATKDDWSEPAECGSGGLAGLACFLGAKKADEGCQAQNSSLTMLRSRTSTDEA